jgi:hypothetical protein
MKIEQKGFVIPLVILIVGLGVGGGLYYSQKVKRQNTDKGAITTNIDTETKSILDEKIEVDSNQKISGDIKESVGLNMGDSVPAKVKMNMTLQELLALNKGKSMMCSNSFTDKSGALIKSVTYMNGSLIRGDETIVNKGITTKGGVIIKGNNEIYSWYGNQGTKMALNASFDIGAAMSMGKYGGASPNQKSEYSCEPWTLDMTKFTPPASVQFADYGAVTMPSVSSEMVEQMMSGNSDYVW